MRTIRAGLVLAALAAKFIAVASPPATPPPSLPIIAALNEAIRWYQQQSALAGVASDPSDVVYADAARRQSRQALESVFQYARAAATMQPGGGGAAGAQASGGPNPQAIASRASDAAKAADAAQANVAALERELAGASRFRSATLRRRLAEAKSELALAQARRDNLRTFADFVSQQGSGANAPGSLVGQVDELERSVPELSAPQGTAGAGAAAAPGEARRPSPSGVIPLLGELLSMSRKVSALRDSAASTEALQATLDKLRAPLASESRQILQQGDALAQEPETSDPAALEAKTRQISGLVDRFKQLSGELVPLGKAHVVVRAQGATLSQWLDAAQNQYGVVLRTLVLRLGVLAVLIAAVLAGSAFWRAATFRYVRDPRRRQQSLLLRRVIVSGALALVIMFAFVNELGSVATFAGFLTAGLAVALQTPILSVVAYFFLIGKYGVRVGDRVQIGGVTGDVVDIGLVRLHLLEVGANGLRTGRVVIFSNAVLFQPSANFFKPIPGSNFAWHELTLTLSPESDYRSAESRVFRAVEEVYREYEPSIAQQHDRMSQNLSLQVDLPRPHSQLRLTDSGLEMKIRFPVPLERAAEIDDRVTRALIEAIGREPRLKLAGSGTPTLQAVSAPGA